MNMIKVDIQFEHIHPLGCSFGDKSSTRCRMEKLKAVEHILVCAELLHQYLTHVTYVVFRGLEMWHRPWLMCITVCSFCKISPLISVCLSVCTYVCLSLSQDSIMGMLVLHALPLFISHFTPFRKP